MTLCAPCPGKPRGARGWARGSASVSAVPQHLALPSRLPRFSLKSHGTIPKAPPGPAPYLDCPLQLGQGFLILRDQRLQKPAGDLVPCQLRHPSFGQHPEELPLLGRRDLTSRKGFLARPILPGAQASPMPYLYLQEQREGSSRLASSRRSPDPDTKHNPDLGDLKEGGFSACHPHLDPSRKTLHPPNP